MFNIGEEVYYRSLKGKIIDKKVVNTPDFLTNIILRLVEFEDGGKEWINVNYLKRS